MATLLMVPTQTFSSFGASKATIRVKWDLRFQQGSRSLAEQTKNILTQETQLKVKETPLIIVAFHSSMLPQKAALRFDEMSMHSCREKRGPIPMQTKRDVKLVD